MQQGQLHGQLLYRAQANKLPDQWTHANQLTDQLTIINRRRGISGWLPTGYAVHLVFHYSLSL